MGITKRAMRLASDVEAMSTGGYLGCDIALIWRESAALSMQKSRSINIRYAKKKASMAYHQKLNEKKFNSKRPHVDSPQYDYRPLLL